MTRRLWTGEEDHFLKTLVASHGTDDSSWEQISALMKQAGHRKAPKQCRDRWVNHLDPSLIRNDWRTEDNVQLIELHQKLGSHWKSIAQKFPGRTDNSVKNQFFSLVRKSLRRAKKSVFKNANTAEVNAIKPKVLSNIFSLEIELPKPIGADLIRGLPEELRFLSRSKISLKEFVSCFAFSGISESVIQDNPEVSATVDFILHSLEQQNKDYIKSKVSRRPRKDRHSKISKAMALNIVHSKNRLLKEKSAEQASRSTRTQTVAQKKQTLIPEGDPNPPHRSPEKPSSLFNKEELRSQKEDESESENESESESEGEGESEEDSHKKEVEDQSDNFLEQIEIDKQGEADPPSDNGDLDDGKLFLAKSPSERKSAEDPQEKEISLLGLQQFEKHHPNPWLQKEEKKTLPSTM